MGNTEKRIGKTQIKTFFNKQKERLSPHDVRWKSFLFFVKYHVLPRLALRDPTIFHMPDATIGDVGKEVLIMTHDDNGTLMVLLLKYAIKLGARGLVKVSLRLVEEEQIGLRDEGSSEQGALPLTTAEVGNGAIGQVGEGESLEGLHDLLTMFF